MTKNYEAAQRIPNAKSIWYFFSIKCKRMKDRSVRVHSLIANNSFVSRDDI